MPTIQIPNHAHCAICATAIPYASALKGTSEERTCSKECAAQLDGRIRQSKRLRLTMFGAMGVFIVLLMLQLGGYI